MIRYPIYCQIHSFHKDKHLTVAQIATELNLDPGTVSKWLKQSTYTQRTSKRERASKLDPFKGTISRLLAQYNYSASQILTVLREEGYKGGKTTLTSYVTRIRPRNRQAYLRLQFAPGQAAQVDWGSAGLLQVGNTQRRLSFLAIVLCHSRRIYLEFTLGETQEQFLGVHRNAFLFFGGVPMELIVDNCKVAVLEHRRGEEPKLNPKYLDFAQHYGCRIRACNPLAPNEKGRVERVVGYVKNNFLAGRQLGSLEAINTEARLWMTTVANVRKHGETGNVPDLVFAEENLRALNPNPYDIASIHSTHSSRTCRVRYESNTYSVPAQYARQSLTLKVYPERLVILHSERMIAEHVRSYERGRDFELPGHMEPLLQQKLRAHRQRQLIRFLELGPAATPYYQALQNCRSDVMEQVQKIVALSELHGAELISRLLEDLLELRAFSADYVANLVTQRQRVLPEPSALHLTRASDLLDLEIPPPDLSISQ